MSSRQKRPPDNGSVRPGLLIAVRLLMAVAMAVSVYLAWISLSGGKAVGCGPESNCDKVLNSRWSSWLGAPVSVFALITYSLILGASFRLTRNTPAVVQRKAWGWLVPCALVVAGAALWFVGLQVFVVKALCPYCMVAHGSGFVAAVLLLSAAPWRNPPDKPWELEKQVFVAPRAARKAVLAAVAALAVLASGQVLYRPKTFVVQSIGTPTNATENPTPTEAIAPASNPPPPAPSPPPAPVPETVRAGVPRMLPVYGGRIQLNLQEVPMLGSPTNAQIAVSLFDYTCHHCRSMHPLLVEAQKMFGRSLSIVSLPMPLDPACNPTMQRANPKHANACEYAKLGLTVWRADRTKHHAFDDFLMAGDKPPPIEEARQRALQLVGAAAFERAAQDPWVDRQLATDIAMYELAFRAGQGSMPQLILGQNVAVGSYLKDDLIKLLVDNLGLKIGPQP